MLKIVQISIYLGDVLNEENMSVKYENIFNLI